jgi:hypothetical protein
MVNPRVINAQVKYFMNFKVFEITCSNRFRSILVNVLKTYEVFKNRESVKQFKFFMCY